MTPRPMQYSTQAIIYLANDLEPNARALQLKRHEAGDRSFTFGSLGTVEKSIVLRGPMIGVLPLAYRQPKTRLVILGHGDPDSTVIATAERHAQHEYTPQQLAAFVAGWLGAGDDVPPNRVRRISLHMCYGGGNRGAATGAKVDKQLLSSFVVPPNKSFAYVFASLAGALTVDVTARTERMTVAEMENNAGRFVTARNIVLDRHKGAGDKFFFVTDPKSTLSTPRNPSIQVPTRTL